jgi:hypothetical protein
MKKPEAIGYILNVFERNVEPDRGLGPGLVGPSTPLALIR